MLEGILIAAASVLAAFIQVLTCDRCGGKRRLAALLNKDAAIKKVLTQLGLLTQPPAAWPTRAPPRSADGGDC